MNSNKIIAIDFGSSHIRAMAAEVETNGAIRIIAEESKTSDGVKHGIVEQTSGAAFKVSELVKLLQNSTHIHEIQSVAVPLNAKTLKCKTISVSRFVPKPHLITDALLDALQDDCKHKIDQPDMLVYDVIPTSYIVDGKSMDDPVKQKGSQITGTYTVVYGHKIILNNLERCFDRTGITMEHNPLSIEALSAVLLDEHERVDGCALINFGASLTTLAVYKNDVLVRYQVIPLGAQNITRDIQELGVSEQNAERLKCIKGVALASKVETPIYVQIPSSIPGNDPVRISTEFLATIIEARLEEITEPIFNTIAELDFKLGAGIVLSGGGAKLAHILDFVTEKTDMYTRFGVHSDWLTDDTDEHYSDPVYAQLIGAIALTDEYRKLLPVEVPTPEPTKEPKLPRKRKFGERLATGFINFFGDENKFAEKKEQELEEITK